MIKAKCRINYQMTFRVKITFVNQTFNCDVRVHKLSPKFELVFLYTAVVILVDSTIKISEKSESYLGRFFFIIEKRMVIYIYDYP